ncbi:hypothetical protein MVEG_12192 [Podila verticillata NRRL 6337]|uniref:AIG1-type G domain-containing protein n=1 Tax=Podila verticillata NRRL 6337 TaxID=1069443 RepID=A0A086TJB1_9FUNG|nr:hypothetical protein MVEG_12192 [Podila verticillata NRRL 6337]
MSDVMEFSFLDTPGFNDTNHSSVAMADNIVQEIISTQSFNLILIVMSAQSLLSREYRTELEYYAKVLLGLHANVTFLYTYVGYADYHHSNTMHCSKLEKRNTFSRIFRELVADNTSLDDVELYKYFTIDFKQKKWPVVQGMIRNTSETSSSSPLRILQCSWTMTVATLSGSEHPPCG